MTEITDSIRPLYRPRAEVHAELAATVERPRYVSDPDDELIDGMAFFRGLVVGGIVSSVFWLTIYDTIIR